MSTDAYADYRPYFAERYAAHGARLSDAEWRAICATVAKAPRLTDERLTHITELLVPVRPSVLAPSGGSPSTRDDGKARRRRSPRPERAA